jgi:hypothetical protein
LLGNRSELGDLVGLTRKLKNPFVQALAARMLAFDSLGELAFLKLDAKKVAKRLDALHDAVPKTARVGPAPRPRTGDHEAPQTWLDQLLDPSASSEEVFPTSYPCNTRRCTHPGRTGPCSTTSRSRCTGPSSRTTGNRRRTRCRRCRTLVDLDPFV